MKTQSKRPTIAVILLICVFSIGVTTAVFVDAFIVTTTDTASALGLNGSIETQVTDQANNSLEGVTIRIDGDSLEYKGNGTYLLDNVKA